MSTSNTQPPIRVPEVLGERLDSWKEIAAYFKRDERTVRRWEAEGLPVHRKVHKKQASVYGYKGEIDAWWHDGRQHVERAEHAASGKGFVLRRFPEGDRGKQPHRAMWWVSVFGLLAAVGITGTLVGLSVHSWHVRFLGQEKPNIQSVAVLPLAYPSGDPKEEYFADGMTEALITELGKVSLLHVISRQSVMQYKGSKKTVGDIGRELNVDAVLEGTVGRSGDQVRVTVHLDRVSSEGQIWARAYDRNVRDILGLQDEIARTVADEIQVALTPQERARLSNARLVNSEAHENYLRGRALLAAARGHLSKVASQKNIQSKTLR